jgi:heat shock protein HtpX
MEQNVRRSRVLFKVVNSWWWVSIALLTMFIFLAVTAGLLLRLKVPPQMILSTTGYIALFSLVMFFFSEFFINLFMGAEPVDPAKYPHFVTAMQKLKKRRGVLFGLPLMFQPRMRILPMRVPNAMAYGSGILGQCCIAITPKLYQMLTPEELEAVVAHEYGHIRSLDIGLMTVVGLMAGLVERMRVIVWTQLNIGITALLAVPAVLLWLVSKLAFGVLRMAISQEREYAADALSAWYVGSPEPLITALRKLGDYQDTRRSRQKAAEQEKRSKQPEGEKDEKEKSVLDTVLPPQRGETILKDLMISHPSMEKRIRSLESLR